MTKYIKSYSDINESIGRGSVILIKGKPEGGKKKLYATHVLGTAEISHGATMLFLSDDFYRIKEDDGKLKAVKISYRSEDSLKSVLNLKSPGKISVVKNNNKTPFHWKTTKHTALHTALKEVESELLGNSYILESANEQDARSTMWNEFALLIQKRTANTVFLGNKQIDILDYNIEDDVDHKAERQADRDKDSFVKIEWEMTCTVRLRGQEFNKYLEYFEYDDRIVEVTFVFESGVEIQTSHDPGDYWTPPYTDTEIFAETELLDPYVDGATADSKDPEMEEIIKNSNSIIKEFLDYDLKQLVSKNLRNQLLLKRKD
jgi:hypothetical protein